MKNIPMLLLDSDFIISFRVKAESTHKQALKLAKKHFVNENLFYLDLVLYEVATVLSRKYSQKIAIEIVKDLKKNKVCILKLSQENKQKAWELFYSQKNKNISFVNCANAVTAESFGLKIMSFDKFYDQFKF